MVGVPLRIGGGQPLLQVGVVGVDGDPALGFIKKDFCGFLPLGKSCSHFNSFLRPCYAVGAFFGCFSRLLTWEKRRFSNRNCSDRE